MKYLAAQLSYTYITLYLHYIFFKKVLILYLELNVSRVDDFKNANHILKHKAKLLAIIYKHRNIFFKYLHPQSDKWGFGLE